MTDQFVSGDPCDLPELAEWFKSKDANGGYGPCGCGLTWRWSGDGITGTINASTIRCTGFSWGRS